MDRSSLAAKIRALLAKAAPGSGATEAEAFAATLKAEELMDKYRMAQSDLEVEAEGTERWQRDYDKPFDGVRIREMLLWSVARYAKCKAWVNTKEQKFNLFGMASDVVFGEWLLDMLADLVERAVHKWDLVNLGSFEIKGKAARRSLVLGAVSRISERLEEEIRLRRNRERAAALDLSSLNPLVVVRNSLVERDFAALGLHFGHYRTGSHRISDNGAYRAGRAAGDAATFNRPMTAGSGPKLLK